jgi:murein L,D-transpeptidase YcbB/YkuD
MRDDSTGYAQLFDYKVESPDYQEAVKQLTDDDRMNYLQSSDPQNPLYTTLREALSKTTSRQARQQLLVNMERCRWRTKQPDRTPRVLVNLPAQQLWAIHSDSVLDMRICFGAKATKTPVLCSEIKYMQVNPDWLIPFSIIKKDVVRHEHDSAYFARNHYYIVDRQTGDTLNPAHVSADQMRSGKYRIGQTGGAHNSLGRIIFRFPNQFDIYLHDTNNRGAFSRDRRALSHGCIRVQKPFELACFLLPEASEWELDKLRISMDLEPVSERGITWLEEHSDESKPHRLVSYSKVSPSVPVYIVYYTVYPNPATGTLETFPDVYGYDALIAREIKPWVAENPS